MMREISQEKAEEYIYQIPKFVGDPSPKYTKIMLEQLGNPERGIKIIHVAGTNGKGSVCLYLEHLLGAAGFSVGTFISPHLVSIRERFRIRGEMVSEELFLEAFFRVKALLENLPDSLREKDYHPSYFEMMFLIGMLIFQREKVQYLVLETGLGGRLDATNSVEQKEACVITQIGLDHTEYLGDTKEKIALEKAGILRSDTPFLYLETEDEVQKTLVTAAKEVGAVLCPVPVPDSEKMNITPDGLDFSLVSTYYNNVTLTVPSCGLFQAENAALALRCIEEIGVAPLLSAKQVRDAFATSYWPGRMERIAPGVTIDGAHNPPGIRAFLDSVRQDGCKGKRVLIFSMVKDKQYGEVVRMICESGLFAKIHIVRMEGSRALLAEDLSSEFAKHNVAVECHGGVDDILPLIRRKWIPGEEICYIAGSLYLVGEMKARLF